MFRARPQELPFNGKCVLSSRSFKRVREPVLMLSGNVDVNLLVLTTTETLVTALVVAVW
jgi:hypothetical protein